ncbi:MAG: hypothetical protein H6925_04575 [Holosporaceae bacterium]|nr:MAG: hypothetical protein H6925_04575 [Holosporaceae bacterium]
MSDKWGFKKLSKYVGTGRHGLWMSWAQQMLLDEGENAVLKQIVPS